MSTAAPPPPPITDSLIMALADEAESHRRTVERRLLRLPVKGRVSRRVDLVLERHGLLSAPDRQIR
jgi:hypothetical protein